MRAERTPPAHKGSLSDYWRIDRSSDRSRELTSILGGAVAQADLVQRRLGSVGRGPHAATVPPVVLDPRLLSGFGAPVPGRVVDCVVGLAVREAALRTLSVDSSLWEEWVRLDDDERRSFALTHRVLEEAVLAARVGRLSHALAGYLRTAYEVAGPPSGHEVGTVLQHWLNRRLLDGDVSGADDDSLTRAVMELEARAKTYLAVRQPLRRLPLAGEIWRWLATHPLNSPSGSGWWWPQDEGASGVDRETHRRMRDNVYGGGESGGLADLGQYLSEETLSAVDADRTDVTPKGEVVFITADLRELGVRAAVTAIKDARFDLDAYDRVCDEMAADIDTMRHVFRRLDDVRSRWRYGLSLGRLDGRGLTKAAAGKTNVFKRRDGSQGSSMALVLLIDVSASMRSYMPVVNRAACVVAEALRDLAPRVWFEVLTYTSGGLHPGAPVQLTRLAASGMKLSLSDVWTDGGTPTGEAIAAAHLVLKGRRAPRKLVLHFTDGHPKDSYVVRQALELCRRAGIDVLTVSVGASQDALYGEGKCEVAYSVPELTSVLARLLPRIYR
jgi:hypothetical protein